MPQGNTPPTPFTGTPFAIGDLVVSNYVTGTTNFHIFTVPDRALLLFDTQTNSPGVDWTLETPWGVFVSRRRSMVLDRFEGNPLLDLPAGDYRISVRGSSSNPYRFRLIDLANGDAVLRREHCHYKLDSGQRHTRLCIHQHAPDHGSTSRRRRHQPAEPALADFDRFGAGLNSVNFSGDLGLYSLPLASRYYLVFEGYYQGSYSGGGFSFRVSPITDGLQAMTLDTVVSGAITAPAQVQRQTFTLAQRALLLFDTLTNSPGVNWTLEGPQGVVVNARAFNSSDRVEGDPVLDLPAGDYQITVRGNVGVPYRFRLLNLANATPIAPGNVITANLDPVNATIAYVFTNTPGSRLYFNRIAADNLPNLHWRIFDPFGTGLSSVNFANDLGLYSLPLPSHYYLVFEGYYADSSAGGSFTFSIVPVADGSQPLTLNATTTGSLASPGQVQRYTFTLAATTFVYFDSLTNRGDLRWTLDGPAGNLVPPRAFNGSDGPNGLSLLSLAPGSYTIGCIRDC